MAISIVEPKLTVIDRLYLGSYETAPDEKTPFPYPRRRSPNKRSSRAQVPSAPACPAVAPLYFSIDQTLLYNAFHADFGPLHIGHLYRFAVQFHEVLAQQEESVQPRPVVFYSEPDSRSKFGSATKLWCKLTS